MIEALSNGFARVERGAVRLLVVALPIMILVNVFGRFFKAPIFWLDELAVLMMVWLAMLGLSITLKSRDAVAVTLLTGAVPPTARKVLQLISDLVVLGFCVALIALCYHWFNPLLLMHSDFNIETFAADSFNYIYQEPTETLGVPKFWFWLILPVVSVTSSVHALANLLRTCRTPGAAFVDPPEAQPVAE